MTWFEMLKAFKCPSCGNKTLAIPVDEDNKQKVNTPKGRSKKNFKQTAVYECSECNHREVLG